MKCDHLTIYDDQWYDKSEADKVIAELEESHKREVEQLLMEIVELNDKLRHYPMMAALIESGNKEIAELKQERRWRKFPDEKPEWGEEVLVVDDASKRYIVRFSYDMKWISCRNMNTCKSNCVKFWMPLPEPPEVSK